MALHLNEISSRNWLKLASDTALSCISTTHILDWGREDYPVGRTGRGTGRPKEKANWPSYFNFMNTQLTELLTNYGEVGAIWFDGWWDHDNDAKPFRLAVRRAVWHHS